MNREEIKTQIQKYIEQRMLNEAGEVISQYKKIIGYDEDIANMEAIINIYHGKSNRALNCIKAGLEINIYKSNLYFTMGNIYEMNKEYNRAYLCYEHALSCENVECNKDIILNAIDNLKQNFNIHVKNYSIIILTYNKLDYTKVCINSIKKYNSIDNCEIIIVDNNSTDGTVEWLKQQEGIKYILNKENKGFPAGCNQGIEIAAKNNDIFLLNNDTVIMPNSIFNLRMGLYSSEDIGAAGSVSNSVSYYQQISEHYDAFDDYMNFALRNNITNEESYEERVKLVGFAMLIKRKVVNEVGLLDERFTPGNYEDDDISLRIVAQGYKLILCKDSYIHHFGSISFKDEPSKYNNLLKINSIKFREKWGFEAREGLEIIYNITDLINEEENSKLSVLQIGCNCGGTLLRIKNKYKNSNLYAIEKNKDYTEILKPFVKILNPHDYISKEYAGNFDYIIITEIYDYFNNNGEILKYIEYYLKSNGLLIIPIPADNVKLEDITKYNYILLKKEDMRKESGIEILNLFKKAILVKKEYEEEREKFKRIIKKIDNGIDVEENIRNIISKVSNHNFNILLEAMEMSEFNDRCDLLNFISIQFYKNKLYQYVLPIYRMVLEYEYNNRDALINIALFLNENKEYDLALEYINHVEYKDSEVIEIMREIENNKRPLISICIPTYNRAKCLDKCLLSIFSQIGNNPNFEIVISDNDSQDNTKEVVDKYKLFYNNIVYWKNEKNIIQENFEKVMNGASGQYLLWHGDDDYFKGGSLKYLENIVEENKNISAFFINVLSNDMDKIYVDSLDEFVKHICGTSSIFMSSIMLKREFYNEVENKSNYIEKRINQTYILFEIITRHPKVCIINNSIFFYENSLDDSYSWPKIFIEYYFDLLMEYIERKELSHEVFSFEKKRMVEVAINWCNIFKSEGKFENYKMEDMFFYLDQYYRDEPYYKEAYEMIKNIRE